MQKYALGLDDAPVMPLGWQEPLKSIGNSTTTPRDMVNEADARIVLYRLCDEVAARLRANGVKCRVVSLWIRDNALHSFERQRMLERPTCLSRDLFGTAFSLLQSSYSWKRPIRSLGVRTALLISERTAGQQSLFPDVSGARREALERTLDGIQARYGQNALCRAVLLTDRELGGDPLGRKHENG